MSYDTTYKPNGRGCSDRRKCIVCKSVKTVMHEEVRECLKCGHKFDVQELIQTGNTKRVRLYWDNFKARERGYMPMGKDWLRNNIIPMLVEHFDSEFTAREAVYYVSQVWGYKKYIPTVGTMVKLINDCGKFEKSGMRGARRLWRLRS